MFVFTENSQYCLIASSQVFLKTVKAVHLLASGAGVVVALRPTSASTYPAPHLWAEGPAASGGVPCPPFPDAPLHWLQTCSWPQGSSLATCPPPFCTRASLLGLNNSSHLPLPSLLRLQLPSCLNHSSQRAFFSIKILCLPNQSIQQLLLGPLPV